MKLSDKRFYNKPIIKSTVADEGLIRKAMRQDTWNAHVLSEIISKVADGGSDPVHDAKAPLFTEEIEGTGKIAQEDQPLAMQQDPTAAPTPGMPQGPAADAQPEKDPPLLETLQSLSQAVSSASEAVSKAQEATGQVQKQIEGGEAVLDGESVENVEKDTGANPVKTSAKKIAGPMKLSDFLKLTQKQRGKPGSNVNEFLDKKREQQEEILGPFGDKPEVMPIDVPSEPVVPVTTRPTSESIDLDYDKAFTDQIKGAPPQTVTVKDDVAAKLKHNDQLRHKLNYGLPLDPNVNMTKDEMIDTLKLSPEEFNNKYKNEDGTPKFDGATIKIVHNLLKPFINVGVTAEQTVDKYIDGMFEKVDPGDNPQPKAETGWQKELEREMRARSRREKAIKEKEEEIINRQRAMGLIVSDKEDLLASDPEYMELVRLNNEENRKIYHLKNKRKLGPLYDESTDTLSPYDEVDPKTGEPIPLANRPGDAVGRSLLHSQPIVDPETGKLLRPSTDAPLPDISKKPGEEEHPDSFGLGYNLSHDDVDTVRQRNEEKARQRKLNNEGKEEWSPGYTPPRYEPGWRSSAEIEADYNKQAEHDIVGAINKSKFEEEADTGFSPTLRSLNHQQKEGVVRLIEDDRRLRERKVDEYMRNMPKAVVDIIREKAKSRNEKNEPDAGVEWVNGQPSEKFKREVIKNWMHSEDFKSARNRDEGMWVCKNMTRNEVIDTLKLSPEEFNNKYKNEDGTTKFDSATIPGLQRIVDIALTAKPYPIKLTPEQAVDRYIDDVIRGKDIRSTYDSPIIAAQKKIHDELMESYRENIVGNIQKTLTNEDRAEMIKELANKKWANVKTIVKDSLKRDVPQELQDEVIEAALHKNYAEIPALVGKGDACKLDDAEQAQLYQLFKDDKFTEAEEFLEEKVALVNKSKDSDAPAVGITEEEYEGMKELIKHHNYDALLRFVRGDPRFSIDDRILVKDWVEDISKYSNLNDRKSQSTKELLYILHSKVEGADRERLFTDKEFKKIESNIRGIKGSSSIEDADALVAEVNNMLATKYGEALGTKLVNGDSSQLADELAEYEAEDFVRMCKRIQYIQGKWQERRQPGGPNLTSEGYDIVERQKEEDAATDPSRLEKRRQDLMRNPSKQVIDLMKANGISRKEAVDEVIADYQVENIRTPSRSGLPRPSNEELENSDKATLPKPTIHNVTRKVKKKDEEGNYIKEDGEFVYETVPVGQTGTGDILGSPDKRYPGSSRPAKDLTYADACPADIYYKLRSRDNDNRPTHYTTKTPEQKALNQPNSVITNMGPNWNNVSRSDIIRLFNIFTQLAGDDRQKILSIKRERSDGRSNDAIGRSPRSQELKREKKIENDAKILKNMKNRGAAMNKTSVDNDAKSFWHDFFAPVSEEYGDTLTDDVMPDEQRKTNIMAFTASTNHSIDPDVARSVAAFVSSIDYSEISPRFASIHDPAISAIADHIVASYILTSGSKGFTSDKKGLSRLVTAALNKDDNVKTRFFKYLKIAEGKMKQPKPGKSGQDAVKVTKDKDIAEKKKDLARPGHLPMSVSSQDTHGVYLKIDINWDPEHPAAKQSSHGLTQAVRSFVKGLESKKEFKDYGFLGQVNIESLDEDAGMALVSVRTNKPADAKPVVYTEDAG